MLNPQFITPRKAQTSSPGASPNHTNTTHSSTPREVQYQNSTNTSKPSRNRMITTTTPTTPPSSQHKQHRQQQQSQHENVETTHINSPEPVLNELVHLQHRLASLSKAHEEAKKELAEMKRRSAAHAPSRMLLEMSASFQLCFPRRMHPHSVVFPSSQHNDHHEERIRTRSQSPPPPQPQNTQHQYTTKLEAEKQYLQQTVDHLQSIVHLSSQQRSVSQDRCPGCLQSRRVLNAAAERETTTEEGLEVRRLRAEVESLRAQLDAAVEIQRSKDLAQSAVTTLTNTPYNTSAVERSGSVRDGGSSPPRSHSMLSNSLSGGMRNTIFI